jgi:hypothetical protein
LLSSSPLFVQYEVGMNTIFLTAHLEVLVQAYDHFWKKARNHFDVRWFSGQWQDELTTESFYIEQYLQPLPENIVKKIELSSTFFNVTMKITDLKLKVPAPLTVDLRKSSDVMVAFSEISIVISSALPQLFLTENILDGEDEIHFQGSESKFRVQTTMNGFSIEVFPSLFFQTPTSVHKLLQSKAITLLASYERMETTNDNKHYLFLSNLLHYVQLNIDFELLAGAMTTLLHYRAILYSFMDNHHQSQDCQSHQDPVLAFLPSPLTLVFRLSLRKIDGRLWERHILGESITASQVIPLLHIDAEMIELGLKLNNMFDPFSSRPTNTYYVDIATGKLGRFRLSTFREDNVNLETDILCIGEREETTMQTMMRFSIHKSVRAKQCYKIKIYLKSCNLRLVREFDKTLEVLLLALPNVEEFLPLYESTLKQIDNDTNDFSVETVFSLLAIDFELIEAIVIEAELVDSSICVPLISNSQSIWIVCEAAQLSTGYLNEKMSLDSKEYWLKTFRDLTFGLHCAITSRQRISILDQDKMNSQLIMEAPAIVKSFEFQSYFHPSDVQASFNDINLSSREVVALEVVYGTIKEYRDRLTKLSSIVGGVTYNNQYKIALKTEKVADTSGPVAIACQTSRESIESAVVTLEELNKELLTLREKVVFELSSKNKELEEMSSKLFAKEVDRIHAYSLLTNDACGYIRVGSSAISSQRMVSITNFWRYWVVLKKNQLILYGNPSEVSNLIYQSPQ